MQKSRRMISLAGFVVLVSTMPGMAFGQVWSNPVEGTVNFLPKASAEVTLSHLGADSDYWDQLVIQIGYSGVMIQEQFNSIRNAHPGFKVNILTPHILENYVMSIA